MAKGNKGGRPLGNRFFLLLDCKDITKVIARVSRITLFDYMKKEYGWDEFNIRNYFAHYHDKTIKWGGREVIVIEDE